MVLERFGFFQCDAPEGGELEDMINDDLSSDSEGVMESPLTGGVVSSDPMEKSYVVKRMNQSNGAVYYQPTSASCPSAPSKTEHIISKSLLEIGKSNLWASLIPISFPGQNEINGHRRSSVAPTHSAVGGILGHLSKSTVLSIFVIVLLIFLFCSSLYLVFRIDSLQRQVSQKKTRMNYAWVMYLECIAGGIPLSIQ